MTPRSTLKVLPVLALLGTGPATLAAPRAAPEPGGTAPLHERLARALYPRERWRHLVQDASDQMAARIAERGSGQFELAPEFKERLRQEYEAAMPYEELVTYQANILQSTYSRAELAQLLAFFRSSAGQKSLRFLDALIRDADNQLQLGLLQRLPRALDRLRPLVRELPEERGSDTARAEEPPGGWE